MKKIGLHPLFLLLGIALILTGYFWLFLTYLITTILHEFAHFFVAKKLGYNLDKIFLMPYGAGLKLSQNFVDEKDETIIALSGPLFNFALACIFIALWWIFPSTYSATQLFVFANLTTGLLNFLPCYPLDGGRVLTSLLTLKNSNRKKSLKICFVFNYIIAIIFVAIFAINIFQNYTFLIFAIFIFLGTFDLKLTGNYTLKNFPFFENNFSTNQSIIPINQFAVNGNTMLFQIAKKLKKNKLNLVYYINENNNFLQKIITEKEIINYFNNYSATTKIEKIIKNK